MWSDTLLAAERAHLLRLLAWGASSVLAGTLLVLLLTVRRTRSPLLSHFAIQTGAWGAANLLIALAAWRSLAARDFAAYTRLDRLLWLELGLDLGVVAVGLTLLAVGWRLGHRLALLGAGIAVVVQGLALLVLHARFVMVLQGLVVK